MRNLLAIPAFAASLVAAPASATGGFLCKTASTPAIEVAVGFGHVPGAPLVATRLRVDGKEVPVLAPQWWLDGKDIRIEFTDTDAMQSLLVMRTTWNEPYYDGQVTWRGKTHWIRCKES